jgi:hypothetical protein
MSCLFQYKQHRSKAIVMAMPTTNLVRGIPIRMTNMSIENRNSYGIVSTLLTRFIAIVTRMVLHTYLFEGLRKAIASDVLVVV